MSLHRDHLAGFLLPGRRRRGSPGAAESRIMAPAFPRLDLPYSSLRRQSVQQRTCDATHSKVRRKRRPQTETRSALPSPAMPSQATGLFTLYADRLKPAEVARLLRSPVSQTNAPSRDGKPRFKLLLVNESIVTIQGEPAPPGQVELRPRPQDMLALDHHACTVLRGHRQFFRGATVPLLILPTPGPTQSHPQARNVGQPK